MKTRKRNVIAEIQSKNHLVRPDKSVGWTNALAQHMQIRVCGYTTYRTPFHLLCIYFQSALHLLSICSESALSLLLASPSEFRPAHSPSRWHRESRSGSP